MSTHLNDLREKRARAHSFAVSLLTGGTMKPEVRAKFDKAMSEVDTIGKDIQRYEKAGESGYVSAYERTDPWTSSQEVRAALAFGKYLRRGVNSLDEEDFKALHERRDGVVEGDLSAQVGSYTGLGFFVPAGFIYDVENATKWFAPLMDGQVITVMDTATGNPLPYPISNDTTQEAAIVGESSEVTEQDVTAGHVLFTAFKYKAGLIKASIELVEDSAFNLESWLAERFAIRFARGYERDLTSGSGTGEPLGLLPAIAASGAVAVVAAGSAEASGGSETGANSVGYTDLVRLEHSVDPSYRRQGKFMLHDTTLAQLKRILDKFGRPLWTPGMKDNAPDTILGYPYTLNQHMPVVAASATTVIFGDLKKYVARRVRGLSVLRLTERYAEKGQIAYVAFARLDARLVDAGTHPVNALAQHS
jgi:HK97 family phage major capsid protein